MERIKLIAVDIDGVLLEDNFSPILYRLAKKYSSEYTAELENNTFSQNRDDAANFLKKYLQMPEKMSNQEVLNLYFNERSDYINENNNKSTLLEGVPGFIEQLKKLNIKLVCYGGLDYQQIDKEIYPYLKQFDQYVCTNDFRPGIKEIICDIYKIKFSEALFIDDVARVAKESKKYNVSFIGIPSDFKWGFQKEEMKKIGVKYTVRSVKEITSHYLEMIDSDKEVWGNS